MSRAASTMSLINKESRMSRAASTMSLINKELMMSRAASVMSKINFDYFEPEYEMGSYGKLNVVFKFHFNCSKLCLNVKINVYFDCFS